MIDTTRLSDTAIAHIARVLQLAILTGTDIMDHLRSIEFVSVDNRLHLSPDYSENFETELKRMESELPTALSTEE